MPLPVIVPEVPTNGFTSDAGSVTNPSACAADTVPVNDNAVAVTNAMRSRDATSAMACTSESRLYRRAVNAVSA